MKLQPRINQAVIGMLPPKEEEDSYEDLEATYLSDAQIKKTTSLKDGNSTKVGIIGIVGAGCFLGFLLLSIYLKEVNSPYVLTSLGAATMVIGFMLMHGTRGKPEFFFICCIPLLGIAMISYCITQNSSAKELIGILEDLTPNVTSILFFIGTLLSLCSFFAKLHNCRYKHVKPINTVCLALLCSMPVPESPDCLYCPVYSIIYNNKAYNLQEEIYTRVAIPNIGDSVTLYINPKDPYDFSRQKSSNSISFLIFAGFLLFFGVVILIFG